MKLADCWSHSTSWWSLFRRKHIKNDRKRPKNTDFHSFFDLFWRKNTLCRWELIVFDAEKSKRNKDHQLVECDQQSASFTWFAFFFSKTIFLSDLSPKKSQKWVKNAIFGPSEKMDFWGQKLKVSTKWLRFGLEMVQKGLKTWECFWGI